MFGNWENKRLQGPRSNAGPEGGNDGMEADNSGGGIPFPAATPPAQPANAAQAFNAQNPAGTGSAPTPQGYLPGQVAQTQLPVQPPPAQPNIAFQPTPFNAQNPTIPPPTPQFSFATAQGQLPGFAGMWNPSSAGQPPQLPNSPPPTPLSSPYMNTNPGGQNPDGSFSTGTTADPNGTHALFASRFAQTPEQQAAQLAQLKASDASTQWKAGQNYSGNLGNYNPYDDQQIAPKFAFGTDLHNLDDTARRNFILEHLSDPTQVAAAAKYQQQTDAMHANMPADADPRMWSGTAIGGGPDGLGAANYFDRQGRDMQWVGWGGADGKGSYQPVEWRALPNGGGFEPLVANPTTRPPGPSSAPDFNAMIQQLLGVNYASSGAGGGAVGPTSGSYDPYQNSWAASYNASPTWLQQLQSQTRVR